ncbi:MAG: response regulator [Candidatus Contendobacter sp.]|nr:response regulator [Candidatus Contendobacter sp.]
MTATAPELPPMPDEANAEILVVDDTPANLRLLANLLTEHGYRVRPASSGALALRSAAAKTPDLILLDVWMPDLDGYAVCQRLKADPRTHSIPVIFISALHEAPDKVQGFAVGGVDYITKPFEPVEVLARVRTHLELWRLQQRLEQRVEARTAELAKVHRALHQNEERLRQVIEATRDAVWDWNLRTGEFFVSDRWYTMLDYAPGEFVVDYAGWRDPVHPDDLAALEAALRAHREGRLPEFSVEYRMRAKTSAWRWIVSRGKVIERDAAGEPLRMVGVNTDITARKRAEAELERHRDHLEELVAERTAELRQAMTQLLQAEKLAALGSLVAGVAHELNTPLGNVRTVAGALGDELRRFAAAVDAGALRRSQVAGFLGRSQEAVDLLERNAARAADLIGHFKQVAVDQTSARRRRFDLRQTVEELLVTLQPQFKHTAHRVELDIAPGLELDSYPGPLEQVLANLIGNSLVHGFAGRDAGLIQIRAVILDSGDVQIDHADDGLGIPEKIQNHIFDPFFTTNPSGGGSGLGLYIVYNLVAGVLGGTIRVHSAPGAGTTFTLTLPRSAPDRPTLE